MQREIGNSKSEFLDSSVGPDADNELGDSQVVNYGSDALQNCDAAIEEASRGFSCCEQLQAQHIRTLLGG